MPVVASIFLVAALVCAVLIGPQSRPWTWGPALLCLGISGLAILPVIWKKNKIPSDFSRIALGSLVAGWFAWQAWFSPVPELGQADLLLLAGAVGSFIIIRGLEGNSLAERILIWGVALLLVANLVAIGKQYIDPSYTPLLRSGIVRFPSGFHTVYNEAANYLIASSLLVGAAALAGNQRFAVRILWGLIAVAGLAAVYFTRSRGGILGAAIGGTVFAAIALVVGQQRKSWWFAPGLIAVPLIGLGVGSYLLAGWQDSQELRRAGSGLASLMDNDCRLYFMGIALTCIASHPWSGGGSRSFGWECFKAWSPEAQGVSGTKPGMVHNELLQAATDYGLIGAGLLITLLITWVVTVAIRLLVWGSAKRSLSEDGWYLGGLAALAGMFVQSCFTAVFHIFPGVILLGICLGKLSRPSSTQTAGVMGIATKSLLSAALIGCVCLLLPAGLKGTQVTRILWPSYLSKATSPSENLIAGALTEAIRIWPQSEFYNDRALISHRLAGSTTGDESVTAAKLALGDYLDARKRDPYNPTHIVNHANLLSYLKRDAEAEEAYDKAIDLQGGMEPAFRGHFSLAVHLLHKARRQLLRESGDAGPRLDILEKAAVEMESGVELTPGHILGTEGYRLRLSIHESLGMAREATGNFKGALESYDFAIGIPSSGHVHYRAGLLIGKQGARIWAEHRPEEAMGYFLEAKRRIGLTPELPQNITRNQRDEFVTYLDWVIGLMKVAQVQPSPFAPPNP